MPQRTNDFQQLVELIHRLFAPQNATVTASALVQLASGQEREVDVLVEFETELYPVRIAVEAKDLSRPIETTTLEQYIGKYNSEGGVKVNKVIIVAKSFARPVVDRARSLGFELHTLTSLETGGIGEFSKPQQGQPGEWWAGKSLGKRVTLFLFDSAGKQFSDAYQAGRLMKRKSPTPLGTPLSWATNILNGYLGEQVNGLYQEHAGESIHFIAVFGFEDHAVERNGFRAVRLGKIIIDFGENMKLPEMQARFSELTTGSSKTKTIVQEKGQGKNAALSLVYEDAGRLPSRFYLHAEPIDKSEQALETKKVVMTADSEAADAQTTGRIIKDASRSW